VLWADTAVAKKRMHRPSLEGGALQGGGNEDTAHILPNPSLSKQDEGYFQLSSWQSSWPGIVAEGFDVPTSIVRCGPSRN
jgi:hypothetical protein